jgi:site-specific recombinase XerD
LLLKLPKANRLIGQRDVTILAILYATGARATELCGTRLRDITLVAPMSPIKVRLTGKSGKTRFVTIPDACTAILKGYLQAKKYDVKNESTYEKHPFSSRTNEQMSLKDISRPTARCLTLPTVKIHRTVQEIRENGGGGRYNDLAEYILNELTRLEWER